MQEYPRVRKARSVAALVSPHLERLLAQSPPMTKPALINWTTQCPSVWETRPWPVQAGWQKAICCRI